MNLINCNGSNRISSYSFNLGICYSFSIGVPKDITLAKNWFSKSQKRRIHSIDDPGIEKKALPFLEEDVSPYPDKTIWIRT